MVERNYQLNIVFHSLADVTRRDILRRVSKKSSSISELATRYKMSFAAIAKHIKILEKAKLVNKNRRGKEQIVSVQPKTVAMTIDYLAQYEKIWDKRLNSLEKLLINK